MRKSVNILLACSVLALAGFGVFRFWVQDHSLSPKSGNPVSEEARLSQAARGAQESRHPSGIFRFERKIHAQWGREDLVNLALSGKLWVQGHEARDYWVGLLVENSRKATARTVYFHLRLSPTGEIESFESATPVTEEIETRLADDLMSQVFFFQNRDNQGKYQAKIVQLDARHFEKVKLTYLEEPYASAKILDSLHRLELNEEQEPQKIEGKETIILNPGMETLTMDLQYKITREADAPRLAEWEKLASEFNHASLKKIKLHTQKDSSRTVSLQGVPPMVDLLARLKSKTLKVTEDRMGVFRNLMKRMQADPRAVSEVAEVLPELKDQPRDFQIVIGALASSQQDAAFQVLHQVFNDLSYPEGTRTSVMNAWITSEVSLPSNTRKQLEEISSNADAAEHERHGALLALGVQAGKAADEKTQVELEAFLIQRLQEARVEGEKLQVLDAIGNSGSIRLFPYVRDYLSDPGERLRARAYLAIRKMPGEDVEKMILAGRSDASAQVRKAVEQAILMRSGLSE